MINIPSLLKPNAIGYQLSDDWQWNKRGAAPLSLNIAAFETYGDRLVQHSPVWVPQFSDLTDVCLSFADAIVHDPLNTEWRKLTRTLSHVSDDAIRFALSVVFKPGKSLGDRQFYCLAQRKVSRAHTLRYDKRYEEVQDYHDGTPKSALGILLHNTSADWIERVHLALRVRDLADVSVPFSDVFSPLDQLDGQEWHSAFTAYRYAVRAVENIDDSIRVAECAKGNIARAESKTAA